MQLDARASSIVGKVRRHNEDAAIADDALGIFAVADGLGGHRAGERASNLALELLTYHLGQVREGGNELDLDALLEAFDLSNKGLIDDADQNPEREGMGTTLTAIVVDGDRLLLGHVGDSRAWRLRDGAIEQLTVDHTVVEQQRREGTLTEEEAANHPMRHVLSRCLGVREELEVDLAEGDIAVDDVYVLATDGLFPAIPEEEIYRVVTEAGDAAIAAQILVNRACERDGQDNITAVVVACRGD